MELKEFVRESLVQIDQGVEEAEKIIHKGIFYSGTPEKRSFEFDIAVTAEATKGKEGGASIKVMGGLIGGKLEGELLSTTTNTSVSRIKFGVHFKKDGNPGNKEEKK